jgi:hypothetical protein
VREIYPGLLKDVAVGKHPGTPAATLRPFPAVLVEFFLPVFLFQGRANPVLQFKQVVADSLDVDSHVKMEWTGFTGLTGFQKTTITDFSLLI